jgi:DNA polymerase
MVQALSHALPAALGNLCDVLRVPTDKAKDKEGRRLILLFCKPRPNGTRATPQTHPAEWARFIEYARLDIEAMRECYKRMPRVNFTPKERTLWELDQKINDRGIAADVELARAALETVDRQKNILRDKTASITDGKLESTTQRAAMIDYVFDTHGIHVEDLRMSTVESMLNDSETPPELAQLLRIRLDATTTSTSKYKALLRGVSSDGRLRGLLQFAGAGRTQRWAGRLFQPQNLPRPTHKQWQINLAIEAMKSGCLEMLFDEVMPIISSSLRGALVAPRGRKLTVADLANIEGRVQAWVAGEEWKLMAFREYDRVLGVDAKGEPLRAGPDLYKLAYAHSFGIDHADVDKDQRQVGKVQELALGYQGGVGAFVTFAGAYRIDLDALAEKVLATAPVPLVREAEDFLKWSYSKKISRHGLADHVFVACDILKRGWRQAHPAISSYWPELETAASRALLNRGTRFVARRVSFMASKNWLFMELPSGRSVCYPAARLDEKGKITYMGIDQFTRKWTRLTTFGGKLLENCSQALGRDVMAENMPAIEAAGYEIALTVHDELICETPDSERYNAEHLATMLAAVPTWAPDLPLAAAGFEAYRYKKE